MINHYKPNTNVILFIVPVENYRKMERKLRLVQMYFRNAENIIYHI